MQNFIIEHAKKMGYIATSLGIMTIAFGIVISILKYISVAGITMIFSDFVFIIMLIVLYAVCIGIQIAIHEIGHLLFGIMFGYQLKAFQIGRFIVFKDNKIEIIRADKFSQVGQCVMMPPKRIRNVSTLLYNYGGCIFNFGISLLILLLISTNIITIHLVPLTIFISSGFYVFIVNFIPCIRNSISSDSLNALLLTNNSKMFNTYLLQLKIFNQLLVGKRPRELNLFDSDMDRVYNHQNPYSFYPIIMLYYALLDKGDYIKANEVLKNLSDNSSKYSDANREKIVIEEIYLKCLNSEELALSDNEEKIFRNLKKSCSIDAIRVLHTYYLFVKKDLKLAHEYETATRCVIPKYMSGFFIFQRDLILNSYFLMSISEKSDVDTE